MRIPFELDPHSMKASLRFDQLRLSTLPTFHREEHFRGTATKTIDSRRQHRYECSAAWNRGVYTRDLDARPRLRIAFVHWERKRMRGVSKYLRANISRTRRGQSMIVDARAGSSGIRLSVNPRPRTVAPTRMTMPPRFCCMNARAIGHWYDAACAILSVLCAQSAVREQRLTARGIIVTVN